MRRRKGRARRRKKSRMRRRKIKAGRFGRKFA
jgi:hypothetical protein